MILSNIARITGNYMNVLQIACANFTLDWLLILVYCVCVHVLCLIGLGYFCDNIPVSYV